MPCSLALAAVSGCDTPRPAEGGRTRTPRSRDTFEGITLAPVEVNFSGPPAARYGDPPRHATTATEGAIAAELEQRGMRADPALHRAARELARTMPDRANVPSGLIEAVLSWAGIVDPPPRLVVVEMPEDPAACYSTYTQACRGAIASLVEKVEVGDTRVPARFGVGVSKVSGGRTRMIVAVVEPMVALAPVPASLPPRSTVEIRGRLVGARRDPSVEVVDPGGRWTTAPASVSADGAFSAQVTCAARGKYQVEVMADGAHGPEVAANFPVYCGAEPPRRVRVELERIGSGVDAAQIARANFEYVNAERKRRGLSALSWDDRAARVAAAHSQDMQRNGFVGHVSPRTGDVSARFDRSRIAGSVIRENVARGYGPKGVHDSLMSSPGHRVNILAEDVTHLGVGVVVGPADPDVPTAPRPVFVTQNFFKKPGAGAPRDNQLAPTVRQRVDAARAGRGLTGVQWDDGLDVVAADVAKRIAAGRRLASGWEQEVFDLGYASLTTNQISGPDFDALAGVDLWITPGLAAGVGVVRMPGDQGFLMIVLVVTR
ncbi:MAG: CAP domain-containing protein [Myxococcota bacterium]